MSAACRRRRCTPRLRKRRISCPPLLHAHQSCYHANPVDWVSCTVPLLAIAPCPFARPPPSLPDASAPRAEPTLTPPHAEEARPPAATRSSFQFCTTSVSFVAPLATSGDAATMCAARDHWRAATKLRSTSCCMLPTPATNVAASVCPASRHDRCSSSNTSSTSSCSSLHTHTHIHIHRCYAQNTRPHTSPVSAPVGCEEERDTVQGAGPVQHSTGFPSHVLQRQGRVHTIPGTGCGDTLACCQPISSSDDVRALVDQRADKAAHNELVSTVSRTCGCDIGVSTYSMSPCNSASGSAVVIDTRGSLTAAPTKPCDCSAHTGRHACKNTHAHSHVNDTACSRVPTTQLTAKKRAAASWRCDGSALTHCTDRAPSPAAANMPIRTRGACSGTVSTLTPSPIHCAVTRRPFNTPSGAQPPTREHTGVGCSAVDDASSLLLSLEAAAAPRGGIVSRRGGECCASLTTVAPGDVPRAGLLGNTTINDACVARNNECWCHRGVAKPSFWWLISHRYLHHPKNTARQTRTRHWHQAGGTTDR